MRRDGGANHDCSLQTLTVLIVDDHPINRLLLTDQLKKIGFNTAAAEDGCDALTHLKDHRYRADGCQYANMNGYQLATYKRNGQRYACDRCDGECDCEEKQRCIDAGMNDCVSKPVSLSILREVLVRHIPKE